MAGEMRGSEHVEVKSGFVPLTSQPAARSPDGNTPAQRQGHNIETLETER
jgi:hypothetical protein